MSYALVVISIVGLALSFIFLIGLIEYIVENRQDTKHLLHLDHLDRVNRGQTK